MSTAHLVTIGMILGFKFMEEAKNKKPLGVSSLEFEARKQTREPVVYCRFPCYIDGVPNEI